MSQNQDFENRLLGKTVEEARAIAATENFPFRVTEVDGEGQMMTMDFCQQRVNVKVQNGHVVGIAGWF
jgi:hypothetical protein